MAAMSTPPTSPVSSKGPGLFRSEIIKIFKAVDLDGSGVIETTELSALISHVLGKDPTPGQLEFVRKKVDEDDNGSIEQDEFVNAITSWLKEVNSSEQAMDSPTKRKNMHIQIKQFFQQTAHADINEATVENPTDSQLRAFFRYAKQQIHELLAEAEAESAGTQIRDESGWKAGMPATSKARKVEALTYLKETCYCGSMEYFWQVCVCVGSPLSLLPPPPPSFALSSFCLWRRVSFLTQL
jgi:hypothetical protein